MVLFKVLHLSLLCNEFCHSQLCSWALSSGREFAFWLQKGTVSSYYNGKPISMWNFKALISLVSPSEAACRSHCHHLTVRAQGWAALHRREVQGNGNKSNFFPKKLVGRDGAVLSCTSCSTCSLCWSSEGLAGGKGWQEEIKPVSLSLFPLYTLMSQFISSWDLSAVFCLG